MAEVAAAAVAEAERRAAEYEGVGFPATGGGRNAAHFQEKAQDGVPAPSTPLLGTRPLPTASPEYMAAARAKAAASAAFLAVSAGTVAPTVAAVKRPAETHDAVVTSSPVSMLARKAEGIRIAEEAVSKEESPRTRQRTDQGKGVATEGLPDFEEQERLRALREQEAEKAAQASSADLETRRKAIELGLAIKRREATAAASSTREHSRSPRLQAAEAFKAQPTTAEPGAAVAAGGSSSSTVAPPIQDFPSAQTPVEEGGAGVQDDGMGLAEDDDDVSQEDKPRTKTRHIARDAEEKSRESTRDSRSSRSSRSECHVSNGYSGRSYNNNITSDAWITKFDKSYGFGDGSKTR